MKNVVHQIRLSASRESQKQQGFFDGRFVARVQDSKKTYTRNKKHKNLPD